MKTYSNNFYRNKLIAQSYKSSLMVFLLIGFLSIWNIPILAQGYFENPVVNAFGIDISPTEYNLSFPVLADMDGDGDKDLFISSRVYLGSCWVTTAFDYYENQGSVECPAFVKSPGQTFGLPALIATVQFVDIDNDGDLDAFTSDHCYNSTIGYFENIGTATAPMFHNSATSTINTSGWNIGFAMLSFGDLDGDGDYDALVNGLRPAVFKYLENIGTANAFEFAAPVDNPFGLGIPFAEASEWSQFYDWDCDGDLDILNSHWLLGGNHNNWLLTYYQNAGSATNPSFSAPAITGDTIIVSTLGDMDGDGDADLLSDEYYFKNITITNCVTLPTASFQTAINGLTISFLDNSVAEGTACNPIQYLWDFGDGTSSSESLPVHTFPAEGTYTVCLTVEDIAGINTVCNQLEVTASDVINLENSNAIYLFPIPASAYLMVKSYGDITMKHAKVEVVNSLGVVSARFRFESPDFSKGIRLDLGELESGFYALKIISDDVIIVRQFVKI